jgi:hypothetical protein
LRRSDLQPGDLLRDALPIKPSTKSEHEQEVIEA